MKHSNKSQIPYTLRRKTQRSERKQQWIFRLERMRKSLSKQSTNQSSSPLSFLVWPPMLTLFVGSSLYSALTRGQDKSPYILGLGTSIDPWWCRWSIVRDDSAKAECFAVSGPLKRLSIRLKQAAVWSSSMVPVLFSSSIERIGNHNGAHGRKSISPLLGAALGDELFGNGSSDGKSFNLAF